MTKEQFKKTFLNGGKEVTSENSTLAPFFVYPGAL